MTYKNPKCALVTYGWCRTSYIALRSLSKLGVNVFVADESRVGICQWSRHAKRKYIYRSFYDNERLFIEDLLNVIEKTESSFLFPAHDETEIIAKYRNEFPRDVVLPMDSYEKLSWANDKGNVMRTCEELGITIPKTVPYNGQSFVSKFANPIVVKLRRSEGAKGVFYPEREKVDITINECIKNHNLTPDEYPIIQERVYGEGWGVSCLYWEGERLAFFTHKRIREKTLTGGTSTARISQRNEIIEKMAFELLDHVSWHGLAMVEFKYNPETKQAWLLEINPRLWGSIYLAVLAGVDFPAWLYLAATKGPSVVKEAFKGQVKNVVARWYIGELIYALQMLRRGRFIHVAKSIWPFPLNALDDVWPDDPLAFLGELMYYGSGFLKTRCLNPERQRIHKPVDHK